MPDRALALQARRRRSAPLFGLLTRASAEALARREIAPLARAVEGALAPDDDVLFVTRTHGVSGLLSALAEAAPGTLAAPLAAALAAERARVGARGARLAADAARIGRLALAERLPFVPLKGAVLAPRSYGDLSLRPAADIDLLALPGTLEPWRRLLSGAGYREAGTTFKHVSFVNEGARAPDSFEEHPDNPRPVDLHGAVRERLLGAVVDVTESVKGGLVETSLHGVPALLPDDDAMLVHLLLHLAPHAIGRGARLVQLVDLARLSPSPAAARRAGETLGEIAWGTAHLAARALPGCLSPAFLEGLARWAPVAGRRERWLSRPGLLTGEEEGTLLALAELPLCATPGDALRRLAAVLPEPLQLTELYGEKTSYPKALARYAWDRFAAQLVSRPASRP